MLLAGGRGVGDVAAAEEVVSVCEEGLPAGGEFELSVEESGRVEGAGKWSRWASAANQPIEPEELRPLNMNEPESALQLGVAAEGGAAEVVKGPSLAPVVEA